MARSKYDNKKYIGNTYGKLTVVGFDYVDGRFMWLCECSCNKNIKAYFPSKVFNGRARSCGCEKINNKNTYGDPKFIGKTFNGLQVLEILPSQLPYDGILWKCKCLGCDKEVVYPARDIVAGKSTSCGSVECRRKLHLNKAKYDDESFIGSVWGHLKVNRIYYDVYEYSNCTGVFWECICSNCLNTCYFPAESIVRGNNRSCGCMTSKHETMLKEIFNKRNIKFKEQFSFDDLVGINGGKLRFDFVIKDSRGKVKLIEYDGRQHREAALYENTNWDIKRTLEHDRLKNEYCAKHNIELIRISDRFDDLDTFERYLINNNII